MAAHIESMMSIRETPWHRIGRVVQSATFDEAFALSGLDWTVRLDGLQTASGLAVGGHKAVVRNGDNKPLGVVGEKWRPLQNREAFDWFKPFVDTGACSIETAGALHGGRVVWVLARCKGVEEEVRPGDTVRPYVLLSNSHDGSLAVRVGFTPIRVVCWNTLSGAHRDEASKLLRVKHTKHLIPTLGEIRETMNVAIGEFQATTEQYRKLAQRKISRADLEKYVKLLLPVERNAAEAIEYAEKGRGNAGELSAWTAYNGVTEYLAWAAGKTPDTRYTSLWYGDAARLNSQALDAAVQLAS